MTTPFVEVLAETRGAQLRREACTARLAALVACCRPSTVARTARRAADAVARMRAAVRRDRRAGTCCTA